MVVAGGSTGAVHRLEFPAAPGRRYRVERSVDLLDWDPVGDEVSPVAPGLQGVEDAAPPAPRVFYRVGAALDL